MAHNLLKVYLHIVFSTRRRQPFLRPEVDERLYQCIGGICKSEECWPLKIGGYRDHVHILCQLNKNIAIIDLIEEIKMGSSKWLKTKFATMKDFSWQQGYGAFSVGEDDLPKLQHYIETQKEHHTSLTFEEELKKLLFENEIQFDHNSFWN